MESELEQLPREHPSHSLARSHGWEMRRGGLLLLSLLQPGDFVQALVLSGALSS